MTEDEPDRGHHEPLATVHFHLQRVKFLHLDHQLLNHENEIEQHVHIHQAEYWSGLEDMDIHGEISEYPEKKCILTISQNRIKETLKKEISHNMLHNSEGY